MELHDSSLTIPVDSFLLSKGYTDFITFRALKNQISRGETIDPEQLIRSNPEYYHTYVLAGDYAFNRKEFLKAAKYYQVALTKEIATKTETDYIKSQLKKTGNQDF